MVWSRVLVTKDMLVPRSDADEYERLIPDARKVIFEDTGHMAMIERPQAFNDCLVEFLAEDRPGFWERRRRMTTISGSFRSTVTVASL